MIRKDIKEFLNTLPKDITLVAATKYGDVDDLKELFGNGVFNFGENRVDAFLVKYEALKNLNIKLCLIFQKKGKKINQKIKVQKATKMKKKMLRLLNQLKVIWISSIAKEEKN